MPPHAHPPTHREKERMRIRHSLLHMLLLIHRLSQSISPNPVDANISIKQKEIKKNNRLNTERIKSRLRYTKIPTNHRGRRRGIKNKNKTSKNIHHTRYTNHIYIRSSHSAAVAVAAAANASHPHAHPSTK
jgi:hypothetical protein